MIIKNNKAVAEVGIGIIIMALLLLVGGIFFDSDYSSKNTYIKQKSENYNNVDSYPYASYLFYLNNTEIGRQQKITESFPNIELGSKEVSNIIHLGSSFRLISNPFTSNSYFVDLSFSNPENTNFILVYFNPKRLWGDNHINFYVDNKLVTTTLARDFDMPIKIPINIQNPENFSKLRLEMEIEKPKWYNIFNWNKMDFQEFKVAELSQNKNNNERNFNFEVGNTKYLERVYLALSIECDEIKEISDAIEVNINGYIVSNENPRCTSRFNTIEANIPLNILEEKNSINLKTNGFYKVGYSVNKIYFNDQQTYKFTINSFNDLVDVIIYGDFDKEVIDIRLNGQTMSIPRDEIKSIIHYLRFGVNELKILTKPVEIKELIIEKNQFYN